jgi:hypothetical protein
MADSMQHPQLAFRRRRPDAVVSAAAAHRLTSLLDGLRALVQSGCHALAMALHQSRSRQAAQMLRRYRYLVSTTGADRDATSTR